MRRLPATHPPPPAPRAIPVGPLRRPGRRRGAVDRDDAPSSGLGERGSHRPQGTPGRSTEGTPARGGNQEVGAENPAETVNPGAPGNVPLPVRRVGGRIPEKPRYGHARPRLHATGGNPPDTAARPPRRSGGGGRDLF